MSGSASGVEFIKRAKNLDMTLYRGATIGFGIVWPSAVAGFVGELVMKNLDGTTYTAGGFNVGNSRVSLGTIDINFAMSATDSAALTAGQYTYQVFVTDTTPAKMLVMSGKCELI